MMFALMRQMETKYYQQVAMVQSNFGTFLEHSRLHFYRPKVTKEKSLVANGII